MKIISKDEKCVYLILAAYVAYFVEYMWWMVPPFLYIYISWIQNILCVRCYICLLNI